MIIIDSNYFDGFIKEPALLSIFKNMSLKAKNGFNLLEDHSDFVNRTFQDLYIISSRKNDFWEIEFMSILSRLIIFLYRNYTDHFPFRQMNKTHQRIADIQLYIDENFRNNLTLDSIASDFFISKYYLSHSFKEVTGFTVMQYVLLKRIAYSKNELCFTDKSIIDIAMDCGFNSQSNYISTFRQNECITPLQFRKLYHKEQSDQHTNIN